MKWQIVAGASLVVVLILVNLYVWDIWPFEGENQQILQIRKKFLPRILRRGPLVLRKENFKQLSGYQQYVTPADPAVQSIASTLSSPQEAYQVAVQWVWVSDQTLHGVQEKWLTPHEFLTQTPNYPTNPVPGKVVSDCESQAYTLVSILRSMGIPATDVRVVVGEVNFSGQIGGHAWVEIMDGTKWLQLEATSGPYWDDEEGKLYDSPGYPYGYFRKHKYPGLEVWAYFNDVYYYNPSTGQGNAPASWRQLSAVSPA